MDKENQVLLNTQSYNTITTYNTKARLFIDHILNNALFLTGEKGDRLGFNDTDVINAFKVCFPEQYKKILNEKKEEFQKDCEYLIDNEDCNIGLTDE